MFADGLLVGSDAEATPITIVQRWRAEEKRKAH